VCREPPEPDRSNAKKPSDVITINPQFCIWDLGTGEGFVCALVWPGDTDIASGKISIDAPIGTELPGHRDGEVVTVHAPVGLKRL